MKTLKTWLTEQHLLIALLATFAILAGLYSITTPLFEMSDELWHYPMVKTLADGNGLPIQDPANPGPWRQEGSQPPLYYYLGATLTRWIDTSDVGEVLRPNPHVDNGIITPDGNSNLIVHNVTRERWPWHGTTLAVHLVRLMSVLMGTASIYFTYRIGIEVFPEKRWLALAGAAAVAFTPMFAFISGAINNDNLATLLSAVAIWAMLRLAREADAKRPTWRWAIALGIILGLAALTKESTLGLFGLAGLTMAYAAWRQRRWQTFFVEGPVIVGLAVAIAGWWYFRNWRLYGDPLGWNAFIAILGQRARPASLLQLWGERVGFMQSYWGLFGGVNLPMPGWTYDVLNTLAVVSVIGTFVVLALKAWRDKANSAAWFPTGLTLIWIPGVVIPLIRWATTTWSSQGRLVFAAISVLGLWFMAGLSGWLPERAGKLIAGAVAGFMGVLTALAPFLWISPRYALPPQITNPTVTEEVYDFIPPGSDSPAMRLLGYELHTYEARPGELVWVTLYWESLAPMDRNWSVFVHLQDSAGLLAGQRDTYPGLGLIATRDLEAGRRWADIYAVLVKESAYAPEELVVRVGLYDYNTCPACQRMRLMDGSDSILLGHINLLPRANPDGLPNPVSFNFQNEVELVGYQLDRRVVAPGETVILKLYWRGLRQMTQNYTFSAQILGNATRVAQKDSWPLDGAFPTTAWMPDEIVEDTYVLSIAEDAPSNVYDIQIVVYWVDESGSINRLQLVTPDGRLVDDFVLLTQIRIGE
jgi:4-amino-4-deoxy-L-arabinose transferase-like glycosyltransferase